jgi:hypothetical protein
MMSIFCLLIYKIFIYISIKLNQTTLCKNYALKIKKADNSM